MLVLRGECITAYSLVKYKMFLKVSTKGEKEDKVHVVLPEGYTTKGSLPERSTTKPPRSMRKSHPLSTTATVTTTVPTRNTFSMPEPVYTATEITTTTTEE